MLGGLLCLLLGVAATPGTTAPSAACAFTVAAELRVVLAAHRRVPMVLDGVVRAAGQQLGDARPLVAVLAVCLVDDTVLLIRPGSLLDLGVEVIVPTLAALLADAALEVARDQGPFLGSVSHHQLQYFFVLLKATRHRKINFR